MRRILTFALLAAFALAASVPVSILTAGPAAARSGDGHGGDKGQAAARSGDGHGGGKGQ